MAYKNKTKQKKHIESLSNIGWRADEKKKKRYRQMMSSLPNSLSTNEKEAILKARKLI